MKTLRTAIVAATLMSYASAMAEVSTVMWLLVLTTFPWF